MKTADRLQGFTSKFRFRPEWTGYVGVEREHFLVSKSGGQLTPRSVQFLKEVRNRIWTYELSACQVESRTKPAGNVDSIKLQLLANKNRGDVVAAGMDLILTNHETAPADMPVDVYPEPRYLEIAKQISAERLLAACRVAGTHIHLGVKDLDHAIRLNNFLVGHLDVLCKMGDHSGGERLRLYNVVTQNCRVSAYDNTEHLFQVAHDEGFESNPRDCWKLIRISIHGTVELRMFGATEEIDEIIDQISYIKRICREVE